MRDQKTRERAIKIFCTELEAEGLKSCEAGLKIIKSTESRIVDLGELPGLVRRPLLAPPRDARWRLTWSSEAPQYGGQGKVVGRVPELHGVVPASRGEPPPIRGKRQGIDRALVTTQQFFYVTYCGLFRCALGRSFATFVAVFAFIFLLLYVLERV